MYIYTLPIVMTGICMEVSIYITVPPGIDTSELNITVSKRSTTKYSLSITVSLLVTESSGTYICGSKLFVCGSLFLSTTFSVVFWRIP